MSMQSCLITGAGGFIGRHISLSLARRGIRVYALYRRNLPPAHPNIEYFQGDILYPHRWETGLPRQIDACIHLAALLPGPQYSSEDYTRVNVQGTQDVLAVALAHHCRAFINMSSAYVSGSCDGGPLNEATPAEPRTEYHISKLAAENVCDACRGTTPMRILNYRISSPYGVGMPQTTLMGIFLRNILDDKPFVIWGTGNRCQNFVHVQDIVRACHCGLRDGEGVFLIAGEQSISTTNLARLFIDISGKKDTPIRYEAARSEDASWFFDISRAKKELGFVPRLSLTAGCRQLYTFSKKFPSGQYKRIPD